MATTCHLAKFVDKSIGTATPADDEHQTERDDELPGYNSGDHGPMEVLAHPLGV